ncbi:hypothetical protein JCM8208_001818 [Rhodotorula glutinis]
MPPKRPATTFTQDQPTDRAAAALAGKRVKFAPNNADNVAADPDADDLQLDLDQDGAGPSRKKGKVTTEGYDSDSSADSDGGFGGAGGGRKGRGVGAQAAEPDADDNNDDDDDMFGGAAEQRDTGLDTKGKKKDNEFLEMGDIEGQEFGKGGDSDDDDDGALEDEEDYLPEDDEANADEAPRGRRSKKGMGYSLSSFNMKEELSEGRFSADGTYTANHKDPLASHDVWLDGLSKRSIRAAREAKERLDQRQRDKERDEARSDDQLTQLRDDCMIGLVALVRPGETVARALNRLGTAKKRADAAAAAAAAAAAVGGASEGKGKASSGGGGGANDAMDLDDGGAPNPSTSTTPAPSRYASRINRLTHYASTLLSQHGELEIYDASHEHLVETLKGEGAVRRDWQPPVDPDLAQDELEAGEAQAREREERERARDERAQAMGRSRVVIARPTAAASSSSAASGSNGAGAGAAGEPLFWYRWKEAPAGQSAEQEYGPYDRKTLATWVAGGFFGGKEDAGRIVLRREGQQGAGAGGTGAHEWKSWRDVQ